MARRSGILIALSTLVACFVALSGSATGHPTGGRPHTLENGPGAAGCPSHASTAPACQGVHAVSFAPPAISPDPPWAGANRPPVPMTAGPTGRFDWYNQSLPIAAFSSYPDGTPSVTSGGAMAFDPVLRELVLWAGCGPRSCPSDETWVYDGLGWQNLTPSLPSAPSARDWASMEYDPVRSAVVLVGGFAADGMALTDTWSFDASGWDNLTPLVGLALPATGDSGLAWDPALGGIVRADGCLDATCTQAGDSMELLADTWTVVGPGPGPAVGTGLAAGSMAWDPIDRALVWFGGYDRATASVTNYTYELADRTGWTNVTAGDSGCTVICGWSPPGRQFGSMTWDAQASAIVEFGGENRSCGCALDDWWGYTGGHWYPGFAFGAALTLPNPAVFGAALAVNSTVIPPFLVGGECAGNRCAGGEWVWESPPVPRIAGVTPDPVDAARPTTILALPELPEAADPIVEWDFDWGDGNTSQVPVALGEPPSLAAARAAHSYGTPGLFHVAVTARGFFGVLGTNSSLSLTVRPVLIATWGELPALADAGESISLTAAASGGTAPYDCSWRFGDGSSPASGMSTNHDYALPGNYTVNSTVADTGGGSVSGLTRVSVLPGLSAVASAVPNRPQSRELVEFTGRGVGGSGVYSWSWDFGDGNSSAVTAPVHTYSVPGAYTVTLRVNDSLGGIAAVSLSLTVGPAAGAAPSPDKTNSQPWALALVLGLSASVVVAASLILLRRRKRQARIQIPPETAGMTAVPSQSPAPSGPPTGGAS